MKSFNNAYSILSSLLLVFSGLITIANADKSAPPKTMTSAASVIDAKTIVPMEQLISQTRKAHGNIVVQSARLTVLEHRKVNVIDFTDLGGEWHRIVYDAVTGKELEQTPMKDLMPIEKIVSKILARHKNAQVRNSRRSFQDGNQVVIIDIVDAKNKRWEITVDAHTGMTINEFTYDLKPTTGKQLSLVHIIEKAREQHKGLIVLRTRQTVFGGTPVRELIARDQNNIRRKMIFNAQSGELLSNKPISGYQY